MKAALIVALTPLAPLMPAAPVSGGAAPLSATAFQPSSSFLSPSLAPTALTPTVLAPAVEENEEAFAERKVEKAKAVQHAHADIPAVDWQKRFYDEEDAKEFRDGTFTFDGATEKTGKELLSYLVTPEALHGDLTPDPERVDFNRLGKTSAQIREKVAEEGVPYHPYQRVLDGAFREGLIYRLFDKVSQLTHYGVPHEVRALFGLDAPPEDTPKQKAEKAGATPFSEALTALMRDAESIDDPELFEFAAQAVDAAIAEGRLSEDAVPASFRRRADALGYDVPKLQDALLTLSESAEGTPWESRTAALLEL